MKSGHAFRLRDVLGKNGAALPPAGPGGAVPAAAERSPFHPPPPPEQQALDGHAAKAYAKLTETTVIGELVHGTVIETWADPATTKPVVALSQDGNSFYCSICPMPQRSEDGKRSCGRYFCNLFVHMGSQVHWKTFRKQVHGLDFDEAAWQKYTGGNQYGPSRVKWKRSGALTKGASARAAQKFCNAQRHLTANKRAKAAAEQGLPDAPDASPLPGTMPMHGMAFGQPFGSPIPMAPPGFVSPKGFMPPQGFMPPPGFMPPQQPTRAPPPPRAPDSDYGDYDYAAAAAEWQGASDEDNDSSAEAPAAAPPPAMPPAVAPPPEATAAPEADATTTAARLRNWRQRRMCLHLRRRRRPSLLPRCCACCHGLRCHSFRWRLCPREYALLLRVQQKTSQIPFRGGHVAR